MKLCIQILVAEQNFKHWIYNSNICIAFMFLIQMYKQISKSSWKLIAWIAQITMVHNRCSFLFSEMLDQLSGFHRLALKSLIITFPPYIPPPVEYQVMPQCRVLFSVCSDESQHSLEESAGNAATSSSWCEMISSTCYVLLYVVSNDICHVFLWDLKCNVIRDLVSVGVWFSCVIRRFLVLWFVILCWFRWYVISAFSRDLNKMYHQNS